MSDDPHQPPALRGMRPRLTNTERFFPGPGRHEHLCSDDYTNIIVPVSYVVLGSSFSSFIHHPFSSTRGMEISPFVR